LVQAAGGFPFGINEAEFECAGWFKNGSFMSEQSSTDVAVSNAALLDLGVAWVRPMLLA
jgi:hypothetical protein